MRTSCSCIGFVLLLLTLLSTCAFAEYGTLLTSTIRTNSLDGGNSDTSYVATCTVDVNCGTQSVLSVPGSNRIFATSGQILYRSRDELSTNPTPLFDPIDSEFPTGVSSSLYYAPGGFMIVLLTSQIRVYRDVATTPVLVSSVDAPTGVSWVSGALDETDLFWLLGSSNTKTNSEIGWLRFNSTSATLSRPTATIYLAVNNYCGSIVLRKASSAQTTNQMVFGCTGTALTVPTNALKGVGWNPANSVTTYSVGAGVYTSAAYYPTTDVIFFGADIGLGLACDAANNYNIIALFFISAGVQSSGLTSVFLDQTTNPPVLFWGATTGNIIRTFYLNTRAQSSLEMGNDLTIKANHSISSITSHPVYTDRILVSVAAFLSSSAPADIPTLTGATSALVNLTKSACSTLPCAICSNDPYCGFCYSSGACNSREGCSSQWDPDLPVCLGQIQISPTSGSIDGRTLVTVTGNSFSPAEMANYRCVWQKADATSFSEAPVSVTASSLVCRSPPQGTIGNATLDVYWGQNVRLNNGTVVQFEVYDCAGSSLCSSCVRRDRPECGWCFNSKSCTASATCPTETSSNPSFGFNQGSCPSVTQISPPTASFAHPATLTISVFGFPIQPSNVFFCRFQKGIDPPMTTSATSTTITGTNLATITCPSPFATTGTSGEHLVDIQDNLGNSWTGFTFLGHNTMELYDCSSLTQCSECRHPSRPDCLWCDSSTCQYASGSTCTIGAPCPSISSIDPPSLHTSVVSNYTINIYGANFYPPQSQSFQCVFITSGTIFLVPATFISATQIRCNTPVTPLITQEYGVRIKLGSLYLMDPHPFLVYDCNPTMCQTCVEPLRTFCSWCPAPSTVGCGTGLVGCAPRLIHAGPGANTSCPVIYSLEPDTVALNNPLDVKFVGNFSLLDSSDNNDLLCGFGVDTAPGNRQLSTSTVVDASKTFITCLSVALTQTGKNEAYLYNIANIVYVKSFQFNVARCGDIFSCSDCLNTEGCFYCAGECTTNCTTNPEYNQLTCPVVNEVVPHFIDRFGDTFVTINGSGFLPMDPRNTKRDAMASMNLNYICKWLPTDIEYQAINVTTDFIQCPTPQLASNMTVNLQVTLNSLRYATAPPIDVFQCGAFANDVCPAMCSATTYCGWCVSSMSCAGEERCGAGLWLSGCITTSLSTTFASLAANLDLTINLHGTNLPTRFTALDFGCQFSTVIVPNSNVAVDSQGAITSVTCPVPASSQDYPNDVAVTLVYRGNKVAESNTFSYVDCPAVKDCDRCIATPNCGWCTEGTKRCSVNYECAVAKNWSNKRCPINKIALGVGLGIGLFALVMLAILIVFLIRRARRKSGLVIQLREPDYDAIAWGTDINLLYRIPDDKYHALNLRLARRDYLIQLALSLKCPATEQDALAKALVYVACAHGVAPEMIQTVIRAEVAACLEENTLFRSNSVASKMYKFYSRIVGIKYLYHCIARVILELEVLGKQQEAGLENPKKGKDTENEVSLLAVSMELDTEKDIEDDVDTDTNLLQLQLICQKILTVLIKTSLKNIPSPLRRIFVEIDHSVTSKFPGSLEAVYKGLGGLFFLRFVCPAITAPHVYGLLPNPPNTTTQRQLVLITKVIQSIANMQSPGKKEQYMEVMGSFIENSIPRIRKFYDHLRTAANINTHTDIYEREIIVPDEVLMNGLAATQTILVNEASKIKAWAPDSWLDVTSQNDLTMTIDECLEANSGPPKKAKKQNPNEKPGNKKKAK